MEESEPAFVYYKQFAGKNFSEFFLAFVEKVP